LHTFTARSEKKFHLRGLNCQHNLNVTETKLKEFCFSQNSRKTLLAVLTNHNRLPLFMQTVVYDAVNQTLTWRSYALLVSVKVTIVTEEVTLGRM